MDKNQYSMQMQQVDFDPGAKYNSGLDIALYLNSIIKDCDLLAFEGRYPEWQRKLEIFERKLIPHIKKSKRCDEALKDINSIHNNYNILFNKYLIKIQRNKKISFKLTNEVKKYLSDYEKTLLIWQDRLKLGMPENDNLADAAWR